MVTVGVLATIGSRSRELGDLAGRASFGWVAASEVSLVEGKASWCLGLREGVDTLALYVAKPKMREDARVDLRDGERIPVEDHDRPRCSSYKDSSRSAVFASWCQLVRVEGGVGSDGEEDRVLRVHLHVLVVLRVGLVPRGCRQVGHHDQVRRVGGVDGEVSVALGEHVLDRRCLVDGVQPERLTGPQSARLVGVVGERPPPRLHGVAGDVVAVAVDLLPELGVDGHVSGGDEVAIL